MATGSRAVVDAGSNGARGRAVLALDIGGTKLAAGVVDESGRVHSFVVVPSEPERGPDAELPRLFELGRRAVADSGLDWNEIGTVGIGCGGPLDAARGVLVSPLHLPGWHDVPVTAIAEEAYDRPVVLENDATAAAAGEHRYGAGAGARNMVYLTISTGVGGGVVVDGRLYRGAGNGAELGHVTVDWRGRPCRGCGRLGCLEAYVSGTSIASGPWRRSRSRPTAPPRSLRSRSRPPRTSPRRPATAIGWPETSGTRPSPRSPAASPRS